MPDAVLLAITGIDPGPWERALRARDPARDIRLWPHGVDSPDDIRYACAWNAPAGLLATLPRLRAVFSLGAGVDHLLGDPDFPPVPVVRVVHPDLTMRLTEYAVLHVLMCHRRRRLYDAQQRHRIWKAHDQPSASEVSVGVMGLGVIGSTVAQALAGLGFQVAGWSRTPKTLRGIATYHGADGLDDFLARSEILVCLLPATPATERMIDLALLRKLKRNGAAGGAHLINAGRGRVQVDADIVAALDEGTLESATLDVFQEEPPPQSSALWDHPRVTITPHNAGDIAPRIFADQVITQIERIERGHAPDNVVDRHRGY
jgi:glyoxylate/hydroxypyruvate reductase A